MKIASLVEKDRMQDERYTHLNSQSIQLQDTIDQQKLHIEEQRVTIEDILKANSILTAQIFELQQLITPVPFSPRQSSLIDNITPLARPPHARVGQNLPGTPGTPTSAPRSSSRVWSHNLGSLWSGPSASARSLLEYLRGQEPEPSQEPEPEPTPEQAPEPSDPPPPAPVAPNRPGSPSNPQPVPVAPNRPGSPSNPPPAPVTPNGPGSPSNTPPLAPAAPNRPSLNCALKPTARIFIGNVENNPEYTTDYIKNILMHAAGLPEAQVSVKTFSTTTRFRTFEATVPKTKMQEVIQKLRNMYEGIRVERMDLSKPANMQRNQISRGNNHNPFREQQAQRPRSNQWYDPRRSAYHPNPSDWGLQDMYSWDPYYHHY